MVMTVSFVPELLTEFSKNKRQYSSIFELKRDHVAMNVHVKFAQNKHN